VEVKFLIEPRRFQQPRLKKVGFLFAAIKATRKIKIPSAK
jgi:hypothetical protein